jgi:hypothetical protein
MSTHTSIDLDRLSHAIESRDRHHQLALYAQDAEVLIIDYGQRPYQERVLQGRIEIGAWISAMGSHDCIYEMTDPFLCGDRLRFSEECRYPDGTDVLYMHNAQVSQGQIAQEFVTVTHFPARRPPTSAAGPRHAATMTDEDPHPVPSLSLRPSPRDRAPAAKWNPPGNFLG